MILLALIAGACGALVEWVVQRLGGHGSLATWLALATALYVFAANPLGV